MKQDRQKDWGCTRPDIHCTAPIYGRSAIDCDCRWCVYNREFNQAHGRSRSE